MAPILAFLLPLLTLVSGPWFSDFDRPKAAALGLLGLLCAALMGPGGRGACPTPSRPWIAALGALILLLAGSVAGALAAGASLWPPLLDWASPALALVAAAACARAGRADDRLAAVVVAGALTAPLIHLAQGLMDFGLDPFDVPHRQGLFTSTLGNSGLVGELALVSLPFALLMPASLPGRPWSGFLAGLAFAAGVAAIWLSDARAAWLGLGAVAAVYALGLLVRPRRGPGARPEDARTRTGRALAAPALALAAAVALGLGTGLQRPATLDRLASVLDADHPTNRVRLELWDDALAIWRDAPIFGVGGGRFGLVHPERRSAEEWRLSGLSSVVDSPHSEPLRLLAEYGLVGVVAVLLLAAGVLGELVRRMRSEDPLRRARATAALAGLAAATTTGLFWFSFRQPATLACLGVLTGLALRGAEPAPPALRERVIRLGFLLCALVAAGAALAAAERDAAAVSSRERLETAKRGLFSSGGAPSPEGLLDLGSAAREALRVADSGALGASLRLRLLDAGWDVVEERVRLRDQLAAARPEDDASRAAIRRLESAALAIPTPLEAREAVGRALELAPQHLALNRLAARIDRALGRRAEALTRLESRLEANPDTPLLRADLANLYAEDEVWESALALLEQELALYPSSAESDASWELLVRGTGRQGRLVEALEIVRRWVEARGDSDLRWSVAGELALRLGETPATLGRFRRLPGAGESLDVATEVAATAGMEPAPRHRRMLAILGRHPDSPEALDGVQETLGALIADSRDPRVRAAWRTDRDRAIARAKALWAWTHHRAGDARLREISTRAARRLAPRQGDGWLVALVAAAEERRWEDAMELLRGWREAGFEAWDALSGEPELAPLLRREDVRAWLDSKP